MAKISVRHGVAQAYGLLFGRPFAVIGLTWLPAVFYAVAASYLVQRMNGAMAVAVPSSSGLLGQYAFFYFCALVVATAFFGALIAVPLTRQAFGLRDEAAAIHLVMGAREFRMFLALLRFYALLVVALVVLYVGFGVAISQGTHYAASHHMTATWQGLPLEMWFNSAALALSSIVFLVLASRYGFFLDAVAAVEDRARLSRASALAQGNFWKIALTWLFVGVPAGIVLVACAMTFGGVSVTGFAPAGTTAFAGILTVGLIVLHTLAAGASACAYAELAEDAAHEAEPIGYAPHHGPAMAFAQAAAEPAAVTIAEEPQLAVAYQAAAFGTAAQTGMEIATPEAERAAASWVAPPPDAHFGADPHDALPHAPEGAAAAEHGDTAEPDAMTEAAQPEAAQPEALAEAVAAAEAASHPGEARNPSEDEQARGAATHLAVDEANAQIVGFDGHPIPDHAQQAEFPPPPLDPAGAIASAMRAQSGFHTPG